MSTMKIVGVAVLSVATLLVPLFLHSNSLTTTIGLAMVSVLLFLLMPSLRSAIIFFVAFLLGTGGEAVAAHSGILTFNQPDFYGIPAWLSFTWGNTALVAVWVRDWLELRGIK